MARPVITDKPILDQAEFDGVTIWRKEGGSIEVSDINYPSMKAALLDIAQKAGIEVEEGWNTQYLGWYIIQQLKKSGSSQQMPIARAERDGEVVIELKEPGTLLTCMLEKGVDMASIKCLKLRGAEYDMCDLFLIDAIIGSYNTLETLDLSDMQMETLPAFVKDVSVKEVILPKCDVKIAYAFLCWKSLTRVTIPDSVTSIHEGAFDGCESLTQVAIPDSVTSIGSWAFEGCKSLTQVTIPDSVTSIPQNAFRGCESLMQVTIPASVTSIGLMSFMGCKSLTQITIPDSVTSIELEAFYWSSLKRVEIKSKTPFELESAFGCCPDDLKIVVPKGTLQLFKASWSKYSEKLVESEE